MEGGVEGDYQTQASAEQMPDAEPELKPVEEVDSIPSESSGAEAKKEPLPSIIETEEIANTSITDESKENILDSLKETPKLEEGENSSDDIKISQKEIEGMDSEVNETVTSANVGEVQKEGEELFSELVKNVKEYRKFFVEKIENCKKDISSASNIENLEEVVRACSDRLYELLDNLETSLEKCISNKKPENLDEPGNVSESTSEIGSS